MKKNLLYILITIAAIVIATLLFPKSPEKNVVSPAALPANGLVAAPATPIVPETPAAQPAPAAAPAPGAAMDSDAVPPAVPTAADQAATPAPAAGEDDVPPGAEVSGDAPAADPAKGVALPPSEGQ